MSKYVVGVEQKYNEELLKNRMTTESNVLACLFADPLLMDDCKLEKDNFLCADARFVWNIANKMHKDGYKTFDEVSLMTNLSEEVLEKLDELGGYTALEHMQTSVSTQNFDTYLGLLHRENTILNLYNFGFNLFDKINFNDKKVRPIDLFRKMNSEQIQDFYESKLTELSYTENTSITEEERLVFDDNFIESVLEGDNMGIPFGYGDENIEGKDIRLFSELSNKLNGFATGATHAIASSTNVGKSTFLCSLALGILHQEDQSILIITNEQKRRDFLEMMMCLILAKRYKYWKVNRRKLRNGNLTEEDISMIKQASKWWNEMYEDRIHFISIADSDISLATKKMKEYALRHNVQTIFFDVFKLSTNSDPNRPAHLELVNASRSLDVLAKKYDLCIIYTIQLAISMQSQLWLSAEMLSQSKQVAEVLSTLILLRNVYPEELNESDKKHYLECFRRKKVNEKWLNEKLNLDKDGIYKLCFISKSRSCATTNDDGIALLYSARADFAVWDEVGFAKPKHSVL